MSEVQEEVPGTDEIGVPESPTGLRRLGKIGAVLFIVIAFFTVACPVIRRFLDDDTPTPAHVPLEVSLVSAAANDFKVGQYQMCIVDSNKALEIRPNWPDALNNRAVCELKLLQFTAAENDVVAALVHQPTDGMRKMLNANLAWITDEKKKAGK